MINPTPYARNRSSVARDETCSVCSDSPPREISSRTSLRYAASRSSKYAGLCCRRSSIQIAASRGSLAWPFSISRSCQNRPACASRSSPPRCGSVHRLVRERRQQCRRFRVRADHSGDGWVDGKQVDARRPLSLNRRVWGENKRGSAYAFRPQIQAEHRFSRARWGDDVQFATACCQILSGDRDGILLGRTQRSCETDREESVSTSLIHVDCPMEEAQFSIRRDTRSERVAYPSLRRRLCAVRN